MIQPPTIELKEDLLDDVQPDGLVHDLIHLPQSEFEIEMIAEETVVAAAAAKVAKEKQDKEDMLESLGDHFEVKSSNHGASSHDSEEAEEFSVNETV